MASPRNLSRIASSGGFSYMLRMPAYQSTAVATYLSSGAVLPGPTNFNASGRAYPDVSAIGHNLFLWMDGQPMPGVDGTSASAPIFAAILTLTNELLYESGVPTTIGFVNPAIYAIANSTPSAFEDIDCVGCVNNCNQLPDGWCVGGCRSSTCDIPSPCAFRLVIAVIRAALVSAQPVAGTRQRDGARRMHQH